MSYKLHYVSDSQCVSQPHKMVSDELLVTEELTLSHKKDPHQADSF